MRTSTNDNAARDEGPNSRPWIVFAEDYRDAVRELVSSSTVLQAARDQLMFAVGIAYNDDYVRYKLLAFQDGHPERASTTIRKKIQESYKVAGDAILKAAKTKRYPAQNILADVAGPLGHMVSRADSSINDEIFRASLGTEARGEDRVEPSAENIGRFFMLSVQYKAREMLRLKHSRLPIV